jgi:hypothetical protein
MSTVDSGGIWPKPGGVAVEAGMIPVMPEQSEGPQVEDGAGQGKVRLWRWAVPIAAAVLVAGVVIGIVLAQPREDSLPTAGGGWSSNHEGMPRFVVTAGNSGDVSPTADSAWFQIHDVAEHGKQRLVASVQPPSPSAGEVKSVVAGPGRTFVVAAWRSQPCETVLYRFTMTDDGQAEDITPVTGGSTPALVAGLAVSPDGRRLAYATAPCGENPENSPPAKTLITLTALDTTTGQRNTWTPSRPAIVGEIVWASDSRTIGYTTGEVDSTPQPASPPPTSGRQASRDATVGAVQVRALHSEVPGTDLLAGRLLFNPSADDGTVSTAVMNPDGRTGYGVLHKEQPPSTVMFTFSEGQPMHVTSTIPENPNSAVMVSVAGGDGPRYACLNGVDAFGRVSDGQLRKSSRGGRECSVAYYMTE